MSLCVCVSACVYVYTHPLWRLLLDGGPEPESISGDICPQGYPTPPLCVQTKEDRPYV